MKCLNVCINTQLFVFQIHARKQCAYDVAQGGLLANVYHLKGAFV